MAQLAAMTPSGAMAREASIFLVHALATGKKHAQSAASFPPEEWAQKDRLEGQRENKGTVFRRAFIFEAGLRPDKFGP